MSNNRELGYVVGAVAGYFTGGASYIALGATIGGAVGGLLDPAVQTQGPRLDDLKVQMSTYGIGIPRLKGAYRVAPNVIWSTDKLENSSTRSAGGKGGGGVENTTFRYYVQMRLLLCETPPDGTDVSIVQIFQDGKLIYDARSGQPVGAALATAENPYAFFTLDQGHSDQLPDPVEEIYESGPGSVPAYRGVVSISMKGIECPGGRVPQFSFVLARDATISTQGLLFDESIPTNFSDAGLGRPNFFQTDETSMVRIGAFTANSTTPIGAEWSFGLDGEPYGTESRRGNESWPVDFGSPYAAGLFKGYSVRTSRHLSFSTGVAIQIYPDSTTVTPSGSLDALFPSNEYLYGLMISADGQRMIVFTSTDDPNGGGPYLIRFWYQLTSIGAIVGSGTVTPTVTQNVLGFGSSKINTDHIGVLANDGLSAWSADGGFAQKWVIESAIFKASGSSIGFVFQSNDCQAITIVGEKVYIVGASRLVCIFPRTEVAAAAVKVADAIAEECEAAGEVRYDVSGIPDADTFVGSVVASPANARANIDPYLTAFQIYVVDEDGAIKFKKYKDITSAATIVYSELGQSEDGTPADPMPLNRTQEIDLPRSVSVSYIEPLNDYQVATEREVRQVTEATEDMLVQLPMAISSDQARTAAQAILFSRWRSQNTRSLKVSRKYAFLSPGDGVTVEYPQGTFRLWRVTSMTDTGALVELTVQPGDATLYTQSVPGATGYVGQVMQVLAPPTRLQVLDIPILRDVDDDAGPYVALDSYGATAADAELFVGAEDSSLTPRGTVSASAPIGIAETVPGAWTRTLVDEQNIFTVNMGDDLIASISRDSLFTGTENIWALGAPGRWEIGKSRLSASLGSGRYTLSSHLRGLYGTELNTGNHQASDTFVLLEIVGLLRPSSGTGAIGQNLSYRAVTKGRGFDSAPSQEYENTGEGLRPLSPVNLRRSQVSNDITLTWDRRSRLAMNNLTGAVPLGEAMESYTVAFYTSSGFTALAGTLTTSTPNLTITSAQQTLFGLTPGGVVYVRVYQNSDRVGAGHYLQATA